MDIKQHIATIPGFPKEGILFRDVTPILEDSECFEYVTHQLSDFAKEVDADVIVGPESRGFWFGIPGAMECKLPFAPVRKPGKLPRETVSESYELEYGTDTLQMHIDAIQPGQKVMIVDDLLATGGTVEAIVKLIQKMGGTVAGIAFVIELDDLKGIQKFEGIKTLSLTHFEGE